MKKLLLILLGFPFFSIASFPIISSLQINDTIINSKNPVKIQVDSLSKYPIGNETLSEYKERLKRNGFDQSQNKQPINWKKVFIIFFASLILIIFIIVWQMELDMVSPFLEN
tara:strand:+ start:218 stop:553 length:336 start_codon:yes stop_codon:yes gene_type:complete